MSEPVQSNSDVAAAEQALARAERAFGLNQLRDAILAYAEASQLVPWDPRPWLGLAALGAAHGMTLAEIAEVVLARGYPAADRVAQGILPVPRAERRETPPAESTLLDWGGAAAVNAGEASPESAEGQEKVAEDDRTDVEPDAPHEDPPDATGAGDGPLEARDTQVLRSPGSADAEASLTREMGGEEVGDAGEAGEAADAVPVDASVPGPVSPELGVVSFDPWGNEAGVAAVDLSADAARPNVLAKPTLVVLDGGQVPVPTVDELPPVDFGSRGAAQRPAPVIQVRKPVDAAPVEAELMDSPWAASWSTQVTTIETMALTAASGEGGAVELRDDDAMAFVDDVESDTNPSPWDDDLGATGAVDLDAAPQRMMMPAPQLVEVEPAAAAPEPEAPVADDLDVWMNGAVELFELGDFSGSLELVEKVLEQDPNHKDARDYLTRNESTLIRMYQSKIGALSGVPRIIMPPEDIMWMNLEHQAGFLLSLVDGGTPYEDILTIAGMPRLQALRYMAELVRSGVVGV